MPLSWAWSLWWRGFLLPTNDSIKKRWFFFVVWFVMMYFALHLVVGWIAHRFTILFITILLGFLIFVGVRGFGIAAVCFGGVCFGVGGVGDIIQAAHCAKC